MNLPHFQFQSRQFSMTPATFDHLAQIKGHLSQSGGIVVCGDPARLSKPRQHKQTTNLLEKLTPKIPQGEWMKEYPDRFGAGKYPH